MTGQSLSLGSIKIARSEDSPGVLRNGLRLCICIYIPEAHVSYISFSSYLYQHSAYAYNTTA